ncbi:Rne/Rng family ribonuclease [Thermanaerosceptrum fracticalcis]|uniref:Ribonuclease G n=1 Tax=Thermanaerosceptrum fracticalcis TaxID=1712410 RepID=A0A7G6DZ09_THEFR|nr:Rne/Rng family ribonuclease [Thermanaerosceptrum fracticalcis]QNB45063.1 Rne/Rng family ribonuclease [Thermanaerosceptrum fracticalcis]
MYREILVQVAEEETKVAVLEEGQLVEIYVERALNQRLVGNIYKGVVHNVLPGMQATFVDIGLEKNAFLYVEDALANVLWQDEEHVPVRDGVRPNIRDIVKEGQEIVVQIAKEPVGTKGARVTTQITLPGRYLVLMPTVDYTGISRRIEEDEERERLKAIAEEIKPPNMGVIVRTVAEGSLREDLEQDIKSLLKIWQRIKNKAQTVSAPALLHKDLELVQRILRDVFTDDVQRLSVNSRPVFEKIIDFLEATETHLKGKVFLSDTNNLFEKYAIDHELAQALKRKVWLKSGGYLVIDQTEALTAIDVNTGKFVGSTDLADTVLKTNLEAALEIARQLRLRNIGGIIIIDFIDMTDPHHKERVLKVLEEELKKDKVKAHILGITPLGLVEMTRKKVRQSLSSTLEKCCPYCEGKGTVLSEETVLLSLKNELKEVAARTTSDTLLVETHPHVTALLTGAGARELRNLEQRLGKRIIVKNKEQFHLGHYEVKTQYP